MSTTANIERLDFGKPPPGYHCAGRWWLVDVPDGTPIADEDHGCADGPARSCREREALGIAAAWAHYKARNDPPAMVVALRAEGYAVGLIVTTRDPIMIHDGEQMEGEARDVAWAWYDCRLALASRLERTCDAAHLQVLLPHLHAGRRWWPAALTWTDEQVAEVEQWLVDSTVELPEVLRL